MAQSCCQTWNCACKGHLTALRNVSSVSRGDVRISRGETSPDAMLGFSSFFWHIQWNKLKVKCVAFSKKDTNYKIPLLDFPVTRAYPFYFLSFSSRSFSAVCWSIFNFSIFTAAKRQLCCLSCLGIFLRREGGSWWWCLQLHPFLDSFQYYFLARIVVQFEHSKRLLLNECHEAFWSQLVQYGIASTYKIWFCYIFVRYKK